MARQDQQMLPSSQGGIVRYTEGVKSRFQIAPRQVIIIVIAVIIIELLLHQLG